MLGEASSQLGDKGEVVKLLASMASGSKPIAHYYETLSRLSGNACINRETMARLGVEVGGSG